MTNLVGTRYRLTLLMRECDCTGAKTLINYERERVRHEVKSERLDLKERSVNEMWQLQQGRKGLSSAPLQCIIHDFAAGR